MKRLIPWSFILLSLFCFAFLSYLFYIRYKNNTITIDDAYILSSKEKDNEVLPLALKIDSINLSLPIVKSSIKNGEWEKIDNAVSYLDTSPIPGNSGNSILYGHNYPSLLYNLKKVKVGDSIEIFLNSGESKKFIVKDTFVTHGDDVSILKPSTDAKLTLYTCDGFLDLKRLIVVAYSN